MSLSRVQRKRTKGFKLPQNTICVDRTSKWGNPFKVVYEYNEYLKGMRYHIVDREGQYWGRPYMNEIWANGKCIQLFSSWIEGKLLIGELDLEDIKGRNLACFCSLDKHCHGDLLLRMANGMVGETVSVKKLHDNWYSQVFTIDGFTEEFDSINYREGGNNYSVSTLGKYITVNPEAKAKVIGLTNKNYLISKDYILRLQEK